VFRVWVPAHRSITVTVQADSRLHLALWGPRTRTVFEHGAARRRDLVASRGPGRRLQISASIGGGRGVIAYIDAWVDKTSLTGSFSLNARLH
jgi:hypothetical protein